MFFYLVIHWFYVLYGGKCGILSEAFLLEIEIIEINFVNGVKTEILAKIIINRLKYLEYVKI